MTLPAFPPLPRERPEWDVRARAGLAGLWATWPAIGIILGGPHRGLGPDGFTALSQVATAAAAVAGVSALGWSVRPVRGLGRAALFAAALSLLTAALAAIQLQVDLATLPPSAPGVSYFVTWAVALLVVGAALSQAWVLLRSMSTGCLVAPWLSLRGVALIVWLPLLLFASSYTIVAD